MCNTNRRNTAVQRCCLHPFLALGFVDKIDGWLTLLASISDFVEMIKRCSPNQEGRARTNWRGQDPLIRSSACQRFHFARFHFSLEEEQWPHCFLKLPSVLHWYWVTFLIYALPSINMKKRVEEEKKLRSRASFVVGLGCGGSSSKRTSLVTTVGTVGLVLLPIKLFSGGPGWELAGVVDHQHSKQVRAWAWTWKVEVVCCPRGRIRLSSICICISCNCWLEASLISPCYTAWIVFKRSTFAFFFIVTLSWRSCKWYLLSSMISFRGAFK